MTALLSDDARALSAAVLVALDVPQAANWDDRHRSADLLHIRAAFIRGVLESVLENGDASAGASAIRRVVDDYPVTYTPRESEQTRGAR
ncbi:hypothetical protein GCM10023085_46060 [Actinomadura viridis]|uniref:Uncharacterized protein n=1 Tax=Actinomadura viridis TaxID=58110 RepID=A0A931DLV4_9ACTN|nr:hypothetical protein [Actinomadura viridis]MBG6089966.1 hypothetical protein [Actinomadura viridis]